jgi:DNA repair protein RadC
MASPALDRMPADDRPRERLISRGPQALSTSDLIAILLGTGTQETNVIELARSLVRGRRLEEMKGASVEELRRFAGIGPAKACALVAAVELGRRLYGSGGEPRPRVSRPEDVFAHLPKEQLDTGQECFFALCLDSRAGLISSRLISKGSADLCIAHPREVFKAAVREGASKILVAHNHPSGVLEPSKEDLDLTERLRAAGRLLGIPLVDHVVVSNTGRAASVMPPPFGSLAVEAKGGRAALPGRRGRVGTFSAPSPPAPPRPPAAPAPRRCTPSPA